MDKKRITADLLFGVQVICTLTFGTAQFIRLLTTTQGVSVSWYGFWEVFLLLNLVLAIRAHKAQPSRVTRQTIASYALWVVMVTADIGVMIWRQSSVWDIRDTITTALAGGGIVIIGIWAWRQGWDIKDPFVKGLLALCFKAIPQLVMAWKIGVSGNGGLAGLTLLAGHLTVLTRLGQLTFSIKEAGWDRNRTGSAIAEIGNEVSWIVVTVVWLTFFL